MRFWSYGLVLGALALPATALPVEALADPVSDTQTMVGEPVENAAKAKGGASFVAMPVPIVNPAIGNGLGAAALVLYQPGGSPRPWTSGVGGLYTDTKSWGVAAFQKAYLGEGRYRVTAAAGAGVFNVKFYGIGPAAGSRGRSIDLEQDAFGGIAEGLVRVRPNLFVGLRYRGAKLNSKVDLPTLTNFPDLVPPQVQRKSAISQLGFAAEYDTRDNEYNPGKGIYAQARWLYSAEAFGSEFEYDLLNAAVNGYHRLDDKSILAWRGSICHAGHGAPFYDICNFGSSNDLRGYPAGQFRDQSMFAVQVEYRRKLFWRIGTTAFVGVGEVAPKFSKMTTDGLLPAAGVGLRFEASKAYHVNASIDFAVGDGVSATYFSIGEAF